MHSAISPVIKWPVMTPTRNFIETLHKKTTRDQCVVDIIQILTVGHLLVTILSALLLARTTKEVWTSIVWCKEQLECCTFKGLIIALCAIISRNPYEINLMAIWQFQWLNAITKTFWFNYILIHCLNCCNTIDLIYQWFMYENWSQ